ncbi:MAG: HAMP domain-containing histidine kinase [Candidatus Wallbacteria bacterium]|nr:HAMP domain-containing histidine kinase [Candidatus Wallbacteria bacterium]
MRYKVVAYTLLNAVALLGVIVLGVQLMGQREEEVSERLRLGSEFRSVRKIHRLVLESVHIADEVLVESSGQDVPRYQAVIQAAEKEADLLADLPPTPTTTKALLKWKQENSEFESLLRNVLSGPRMGGATETTRLFETVKKQAAEQTSVLQEVGDGLSERIVESDSRLRGGIGRTWTQVVLLSLLPFGALLVLIVSFTRRLSEQVQKLTYGFEQLAAGNFQVRLAVEAGTSAGASELSALLHSFDRSAGELEKYSRMRSQFLSMAAHDLRSPLSTLLMAARSLEEPGCPEARRARSLSVIRRKSEQLLKLADTMLDGAFLELGRIELLLARVDLGELMKRCAEDIEERAAQRQQKLRVEPFPGDPFLWCDPVKLYQILENLLSNAVKYSVESDTIILGASELDGGTVLFRVEDHGPGVPEADRKEMFEPWRRLTGVQGPVEGTGLGLAICRAFVRAHGGSIWVESEVGVGCRVCFTISRQHDA